MFAMIEIPHQTPARFHVYESDRELIQVAYDLDAKRGEDHDIDSRSDAIEILSSDLHGHIIVETAADLDYVRSYTGHQRLRVVSMADAIECELFDGE